MTLIHRFTREFADDGNRHLLKVIRLALGVDNPKYRWGPETLPAAGVAVSPWTAELAPATRESFTQATAAKKPVVTLSNNVKTLDFDGVDDDISVSFGGAATNNVAHVDNPQSLTLMLKLDTLPPAGVTQHFLIFGGGTFGVRGDGLITSQFLATDGGAAPYASPVKKIVAGQWFTVTLVATRNGFHEYTIGDATGIEHVTFGAGNTRGFESLKIGSYTGTYYLDMSVVTILGWGRELTRTERATLAENLPLMYQVA